jgi:hypothetical protein
LILKQNGQEGAQFAPLPHSCSVGGARVIDVALQEERVTKVGRVLAELRRRLAVTAESMWNGTPCNKLPNATPNTTLGTSPPANRAESQNVRQRVSATLLRNSNPTGLRNSVASEACHSRRATGSLA